MAGASRPVGASLGLLEVGRAAGVPSERSGSGPLYSSSGEKGEWGTPRGPRPRASGGPKMPSHGYRTVGAWRVRPEVPEDAKVSHGFFGAPLPNFEVPA